MEVIKSYLTIIDPYYLNSLKGDLAILVEGILSGDISTDEEARALFDFSDRNYDKLKEKARRVLTSFILVSNHGQTEVQKAYNFCQQGRAISMVLLGKGVKGEGIKIARKVFHKADEFGFVHIANELAAEISQHYSTIEPNSRLRKKYAMYSEKYLKILVAQTRAQKCYTEIALLLGNSTSYTRAAVKKLKEYTAFLEQYRNIDSPRIQLFVNSLFIIKHFAMQEYKPIIQTSEEVIEYFKSVKSKGSYYATFMLYKGLAYIALKKYAKAESTLFESQQLVVSHKASWQWIMLYRTILAFHAAQYDKVYSLYQEGFKKNSHEFLRERWRIIGAYIYLFSKTEKLYTGRTRFGIGKFLNETAGSSLDKQGLNINIIIIVLLLLLQQKRYSEFLDRMDGLQSYLYRHTRNKATARARLFLKMISHIPKYDFQSRTFEYEMAANFRKLQRMPVYASHNWEIELVPFEMLWEVVVDLLESRRRAVAV